MRYPTYEELMEKETTGGKIRECAITTCPPERPKRCTCTMYDRPIVCAQKKKYDGVTRCAKFKTANIDKLNRFPGKDGNEYTFAWNKDERKYIIYKNNKVMQKFAMANLSYGLGIFWELADELSKEPRRKKSVAPMVAKKPVKKEPAVERVVVPIIPTKESDVVEDAVLRTLTAEPTHINEIVVATKLPVGKVMSALLALELEGLIKRLPGAYFAMT